MNRSPLHAEDNFVQYQFDTLLATGFIADAVVLQRVLLQRVKSGFAGYDLSADAFTEAAVAVVNDVVDDFIFDQLRSCFKTPS